MRCTNSFFKKVKLLCVVSIAAIFIAGCGSPVENAYETYSTDFLMGYTGYSYFADSKCVINDVNFGQESVNDSWVGAAGVFNLDSKEVKYSQNIFKKMYPASTTKILTAYIIIRNCSLEDTVTVSANAAAPGSSSSVCGLKEGDQISVKDLLYGLMLESGNDAAIALAEHYSGSEEAFAEVMNETANMLGATNSHFMNASGLPDEEHYTTVYDMYLIFSSALELSIFEEIISSTEYDATYINKSGNVVEEKYKNTNRYLTGEDTMPEGFTPIGGKTGTTNAAGYCLVMCEKNADNDKIISIVYKSENRSNLYEFMNQIISTFGN